MPAGGQEGAALHRVPDARSSYSQEGPPQHISATLASEPGEKKDVEGLEESPAEALVIALIPLKDT